MIEIFERSVVEAARERFRARTDDPIAELAKAKQSGDPVILNRMDELSRFVNRFVHMGRPDLAAELVQETNTGAVAKVSVLERVIQQNELMAVAFFSRGMTAARSVGRVVVRDAAGRTRGHGTGFMISPRLMMTNNHVLNNERSAASSLVEFDYALGVDGQPMITRRFRLDPTVFFETSVRLDFSIIAVEPANGDGEAVSDRGWIHLIAESGKAIAGEPINIIQHPGGERQQIAIRENRIVRPEGDFLIYETDTMKGSSGSPALNDQWQLAALHHAGVPAEDSSGNWLRKDGHIYRSGIDDPSTVNWVANEGVRISRIVENMRSRSLSAEKRALFEEAFAPAPRQMDGPASSGGADHIKASPGEASNSTPAGMQVGRDGIARWTFQLSFGPLSDPQSSGDAGGKPTNSAPAIPSLISTKPEPDTNTNLGSRAESVFERRGEYYSADEDRTEAKAYYDGIRSGLSKKQLFKALHDLVKGTHTKVFDYATARHEHLYPWIDRHKDETLKSIYSKETMPEELFVAERLAYEAAIERAASVRETTIEALPIEVLEEEDAALEAAGKFNCEHVVPQSWFRGEPEQRAQKSDLHHLFTCETGCNSFRSNIPYFDFTSEEEAAIRAAEISPVEALLNPALEAVRAQCGLRDGRRFEPSAGKGAVARATLYFLLRYPGVVGDVKTGPKKEFVKSNVGLLIDWAKADPPKRYEQHRNAEIAKVQGNRNPLIDRPDWLKKIAFDEGFG